MTLMSSACSSSFPFDREGTTPIRCVPGSLPPESSDCSVVCALACGCSRCGVAAVPVDARDLNGGIASSRLDPALGRDLDLHLVLSRFPPYPSFRRLRVVRRAPRALRVLVVFIPVVLFASLALGPVAHPLGAVRAERPSPIRPSAPPDSSRSPRPANRPRQPEAGPIRWRPAFGGAPRGGRSDCRREQRGRARTEAWGLARPVVCAELDPDRTLARPYLARSPSSGMACRSAPSTRRCWQCTATGWPAFPLAAEP